MTGDNAKEIFKIWAPAGAKWSAWARPVPFVSPSMAKAIKSIHSFKIPNIRYLGGAQQNTAVVIDLPGHGGVEEGLALARLGFRPVPLYNGTTGQPGALALVDNFAIEGALEWGASELKQMELPADAPPAFLLDSNRTHRYRMDVSVFDNSWDIYAQDMPPAGYFLENGIEKIVVRGERIQKDLAGILHKFQKAGIKILFTKGYDAPKEIAVKKPRRTAGQ